jgi:hypothetical protein
MLVNLVLPALASLPSSEKQHQMKMNITLWHILCYYQPCCVCASAA